MQDFEMTLQNMDRMLELMKLSKAQALMIFGEDGAVTLMGADKLDSPAKLLAKGLFEAQSNPEWKVRMIQRAQEKFSKPQS